LSFSLTLICGYRYIVNAFAFPHSDALGSVGKFPDVYLAWITSYLLKPSEAVAFIVAPYYS